MCNDSLSKEILEKRIQTSWAGRNVVYYEETDSTNVRARQTSEKLPHGTLFVAERQTLGRGRRGRGWESSDGKDIFLSVLLKPDFSPEKAPMLTIAAALAAAETVREVSGADARIKWPNDLVVEGKKICGILTEMGMDGGRIREVVVGIGINVNREEFPEEIRDRATSLAIETGASVPRAELISVMMEKFEQLYTRFSEEQSLSFLREAYNSLCANCGRRVRVLETSGEWEGTALGIDDGGELLVEKEDGQIVPVYAGEVSVRGIYGYV